MDLISLYHREYKALLRKVGLQDQGFTYHCMRHTFAAALFARCKHPKVVQSLLGHASITQTLDTYWHLVEGMGNDASRWLGRGVQRLSEADKQMIKASLLWR